MITDLTRKLTTLVAMLVVALGVALATAPAANAAAYPVGVYAPKKIDGNRLEGWANLSRDCGGTMGCFNYIKLERKAWNGAAFFAGQWAGNNGWNSIAANLPNGCAEYRTTTDSYNDVVGDRGAGVNIGPAGVSANGAAVNRFKQSWSSGWTRICR